MRLRKKPILFMFLILLMHSVTSTYASQENKQLPSTQENGTVYEKYHVGLFTSKARRATHEPLLGDRRLFTKPIFSVLDSTDRFLGKTLHTKTYVEENNDSFVTLEQDGAKLGYDF